ncbi:MAG: response regulator transcription factor, partial [Planctomycetota bacterium]
VVDDQLDIRDLTAEVLAGDGYAVTTAGSGSEALRLLGSERFDLVLLDVNMPEMDGWQTLRLIRADDLLGGLPVVMFTVKGEFRDKVQGLQEGALDYITKPFVVDALLARIRRIFEGGEAADMSPGLPLER